MNILGRLLIALSLLLSPSLAGAQEFPDTTHQADRPFPRWRAQRHHCPHRRPAHVGADEAACHYRQSRRPERRARHRCGRESRARRLHHRHRQSRGACDQPEHGEGRLRDAAGFGADHAGRHRAGNAGRGEQRAGEQHERAGGAGEGAARQTEFRLHRSRQPAASCRRTAQAHRENRHRACPLSGCCARHHRSAQPAGADDLSRPAGDPAAYQERRAEADRTRHHGACAHRARCADHCRSSACPSS